MKKIFAIILVCMVTFLSACNVESHKYKRIDFRSDSLGEELADHLSEDTEIVKQAQCEAPTQLPIYEISKRNISEQEYQQMLEALDLPATPYFLELEENKLDYDLASIVDSSRGYFEGTDAEAEALAWEIFNQIPFIEGQWECEGIKDTYTMSDSAGEHILRAGVRFKRVLDGVRVTGEEKCVLYFDGSGLVEISITLFNYNCIGSMDLVTLEEAETRIKTPDHFIFGMTYGAAQRLSVEKISVCYVNQHSRGCEILQPVYVFSGTADMVDGGTTEFKSIVIAIPDKYTYEE